MKITQLRSTTDGDHACVSATITWEDCGRGPQEIYIETDARFAADLSSNPHAFLLSAAIPAMHFGEKRIRVDGRICPKLRNGLMTAFQVLRSWYGQEGHGPLTIEATGGFEPPLRDTPARTVSFMSAGVDSLAMLRRNRVDYPLDHPGSIRECIFVYGFDVGGYEAVPQDKAHLDLAVASMSSMVTDAKVTLIPVCTNLRHLEGDEAGPYNNRLFTLESHGAAMSAIAHAFSRRFSSALIASSYAAAAAPPYGSHMLLDPNYSSCDLRIEHEVATFTRLEKVGIISDWDGALRTLRVCQDPMRPASQLNCGTCEKCVRTMIQLLVFDKLTRCKTFDEDDVTADMVTNMRLFTPIVSWFDLIEVLSTRGRLDLVRAIQDRLAQYKREQIRIQERDWKGRLKRLDRQLFRGRVLASYHRIK